MGTKYDDRLVKKAYKRVQYTKEQIDELRNCMDPVDGPMYFLTEFMWIQHPTKGRMKFKPYDFQADLVYNYHNFRKSVNMIGRQLGKTTVAAGYLLWYAMFVPDSHILIASSKLDGALDIMDRVRFAYESIPDHIRGGVFTYNKKSIEFDNGSKIQASTTTSTTGRGLALSLIYLDEFAFVEQNIAREFWTSLSPTLSTGGKCIITTTPDTDEDQFAEIWFNANKMTDEFGNEQEVGINGFRPYHAIWSQHPDRDEIWAKEERESIGEERFLREHECQFITFEETLINPIKLAFYEGTTPMFKTGQVRWYGPVRKECTYVLALDPAMGTGGDNAAIQVWELPTLNQIAEWQHNKTTIEGQLKVLNEIGKELESKGATEIYWSVENNTLGEAALVVIRDTGEENFAGTMLHDPHNKVAGKRKGFSTTNRSKMEACSKLKTFIETKKVKMHSKNLISELKTFVARGNTFEARPGTTDDLVMATLLFIRMADFISSWDDLSYEVMNSSLHIDEFESEDTPLPILFL